MLSIKTNNEHPSKQGVAASFNAGDLFRDNDGDLHLRLPLGCVRFEGDQMYQYSESELDDLLDCCAFVPGDVTININLR